MLTGPAAPLATRSRLAVASALAVGFAATFLLPYLVPVAPSVSDSYLVGFHNRTCVSIFLVFLAAFSWWTGGFGLLAQPSPQQPETPSRSLLGLVLLVFLSLTLGEWLLLLHHPVIQEAIYFLDRLRHLALGQLPYRDFEFAYGPLLLYGPLALARLTGLSLTTAYFCSWILEFLAGVVFIHLCLVPFPASRAQKNILFLLFAASWWAGPLCFGPNYTPFRFFLAPLLAILIAPRLTSAISSVRLVAEVLLAETLLLLVSPEQAIAFVGATLLFLALTALRTRSSLPFTRLVAVLAGSFFLLLPLHRLGLFQTASAMSRGGFNFPLLPSPQQIPLFILVLVSAAALASAILRRHPLGAVEMLVLLGLLLLPAAFGRADPGHFLINTTPLALSGLLLLAQRPSAFRALTITYAVFVLLLPAPLILKSTLPAQRAAMRSASFPPLPASDGIPFAPFTYPSPTSSATPAFLAQTGFYDGLQNVVAPEQVDRAMAELRTLHPRHLLVPEHPSCTIRFSAHYLRRALDTPLVPPGRHISFVRQPLCDYINAHFTPDPTLPAPPAYQIWIEKP